MKNRSVTRVVAVVTLTCLLAVFALPAAASPFGGTTADGFWSPSSLVQWFQGLWSSWLGVGDDAPEGPAVQNVHANLENALDPDGQQIFQTGTDPGGEELSSPWGTFGTGSE